MKLYHGSKNIIKNPSLSLGKIHNDYGKGFYLTESKNMASEWACKENTDGFCNEYLLDSKDLKILNLLDKRYNVLNWIAILLKNRTFNLDNEIAISSYKYIIDNFYIDTKNYDVVIGYRADDSYFSYASSFINNTIPLRILKKALSLGMLGEQVVLISEKAFTKIKFKTAYNVDKETYYNSFYSRDLKARLDYKDIISKNINLKDDIFVIDIIREEMKQNDPRLQ